MARAVVQARLDAISDVEYRRMSAATCENVQKLLESILPTAASSSTLLLYSANPIWREVPLVQIERTYHRFQFDYVSSEKDTSLPNNLYDIIFVPLYGYTSEGYRLGHGGGWYDRMLALQPQAVRVGVGLECGVVDFLVDEHDIPMDIVVTDQRITVLTDIDKSIY